MKKYAMKIEETKYIGLPADIFNKMKLKQDDEIEVTFDTHKILIKKTAPECLICGTQENLRETGSGRLVCAQCLEALRISLLK